MSDDTSQNGNPDRQRIDVSEEYELRDWAEKFGVSREQLKQAVSRAGTWADDVARELQGNP